MRNKSSRRDCLRTRFYTYKYIRMSSGGEECARTHSWICWIVASERVAQTDLVFGGQAISGVVVDSRFWGIYIYIPDCGRGWMWCEECLS